MMDEQFAQYVATAFANATAGLWPYPHADILDDGTFILLTVEVPTAHTGYINDALRSTITETLDAIVPTVPDQHLGTWIVAFVRDGAVYAAI